MREIDGLGRSQGIRTFPFLFGGTFIEGLQTIDACQQTDDFPSFSEGLSLRDYKCKVEGRETPKFPFLFGGTFIEGYPADCIEGFRADFPSFSEGLSLRGLRWKRWKRRCRRRFPFLFGGTFIEGSSIISTLSGVLVDFPSFSEGLSLRASWVLATFSSSLRFPFLFGGTFIEGYRRGHDYARTARFPFLFGGTFIEGSTLTPNPFPLPHFPSFSEGLSLRESLSYVTELLIAGHFPSFSEGLSLRGHGRGHSRHRR